MFYIIHIIHIFIENVKDSNYPCSSLGGLACETRYFTILVVIITLLGVILVEVGK